MADKKELLRLVGSMQQLAYVRPVTFEEGRARGMRAFERSEEHTSELQSHLT